MHVSNILKSGAVTLSLSLALCPCVCESRACLCERVSFVLSFYQKHTRQINQMSQWAAKTGRNGTARCLHPSPLPTAVVAAIAAADDDELSLAQYVLRECMSVCVCLYSASVAVAVVAVNCRQFPRHTSTRQLCFLLFSALLLLLLLLANANNTRTTHTHHHNSCVCPYIYVRVSVCVRLLI